MTAAAVVPIAKRPGLKLASLAVANSKSDPKTKAKLGLRVWMERVVVECDRAANGLDNDPVHDLRVALRRCRSLADGMIAIDPDCAWKDMKKAGRKLFQALGELRDMQVMLEWIEKLSGPHNFTSIQPASNHSRSGDLTSPPSDSGYSNTQRSPAGESSPGDDSDPVVVKLLEYIRAREAECKGRARKDLDQFDRKQWRQWSRTLPQRAARVRPGSATYQHLTLEKWTAAYDLHKHALRTRSQPSWHELRIGIKRFRYTVENFLPRQHALWGSDLKDLQDLLGDVHDLDVLWALAVRIRAFPGLEHRRRWREKLNLERGKRIARYREKMVGRQSLWQVWRAELPSGPALRTAAMSRFRVWAGYLDPDFAHSQRVAQWAILLYEGLQSSGILASTGLASTRLASTHSASTHSASMHLASIDQDPRAILQAAALMHDIGRAKGEANHQKASWRMIRSMTRPLGWSARELDLAAVVARYHRGALPRPRAKTMQLLELPDRPVAMKLAGILRLAAALDSPDGNIGRENESAPRLEIRLRDRCVELRVAGYSALNRSAEGVAAARHLLETVLRRPVLVQTLRVAGASERPGAGVKATRTLARPID